MHAVGDDAMMKTVIDSGKPTDGFGSIAAMVEALSYLPSNENRPFPSPPGFIRGPLPLGPTSQRADQSALAVRGPVGRAALPQRDGGMGTAFERRLAYMHINALDESTGSPADI